MNRSMAEELASLSPEEREQALDGIELEEIEHDPRFWLRPNQLEALDATEWLVSMIAGRGAGKTRVGAEWVRDKARVPGTRFALVARTTADVRDTMVNGESGLMAVHAPSEMPEYTPSLRRVTWPNGSVAITYSSEEPSQLRGPQFFYSWADELAAWNMKPDNSGLTAWDNLKIATRLGPHPQIFMSTTPKRIQVIRDIIDMAKEEPERVNLVRGSTMDNAANLSASYIQTIYEMYAGTSIERQELYGELLDSVEGALWSDEIIRRTLDLSELPNPNNRVCIVGVDPTVAEEPGDECGIIVIVATKDRTLHTRKAWVVDDRSVKGSPDTWAKAVVKAAKEWGGIVVAEKNQGGALVKNAIKSVDPSIPVLPVWAAKGKAIRAEPVVMAYEQGRVSHFGHMVELEDELTGWVPGESGYSPNRLDALVWALSAALVDEGIRNRTGSIRAVGSGHGRRISGIGERPGGLHRPYGGSMQPPPWRTKR